MGAEQGAPTPARGRLVLGIGASSAATAAEVAELAGAALGAAGAGWGDVAAVATTTRLAGDGRLSCLGPPVVGVGATELAAVPGVAPSRRALAEVGTPSVAEAAALAVAGPGGRLVVPRRTGARVTAAVARRP